MADDDRPRETLSTAEAAAALGISLDRFSHVVKRWQRDHGFPKPLPLIRRYDPLAIKAWQDRLIQANAPDAPSLVEADFADEIVAAQALMDLRARNAPGAITFLRRGRRR